LEIVECEVCRRKEAALCVSVHGRQGYVCRDCAKVVEEHGWVEAENIAQEQTIPPDLFSVIVGYDDVKQIFIRALKAKEPVHILLEGPPFSGKSMFLMELERAGASRVDLGPNITNAGLVRYLVENKPRILVIDEIDEARKHQLDTLYGLMSEKPVVSELKTGRVHYLQFKTKVFASCNDSTKLPEKLVSRFIVLKLPRYTDEQFLEVTTNVLVKQEGKSLEVAEHIAHSMLRVLRRDNIRIAIKIARMCETIEDVDYVISVLKKYC
jgi:MoxR-like ATPase